MILRFVGSKKSKCFPELVGEKETPWGVGDVASSHSKDLSSFILV